MEHGIYQAENILGLRTTINILLRQHHTAAGSLQQVFGKK